MKKILESDITFDNATSQGRYHYQDIMAYNKIVGCIVEIDTGFLNPIKTRYQINVSDTIENKQYDHEETEDAGRIIIYFYSLETFLDFINNELTGS